MAASFAKLPCKVLWRLTSSEVPDESASTPLRLGSNTKVHTHQSHNCTAVFKCAAVWQTKLGQAKTMQSNAVEPTASALLMQVVTWVPQNDILAHPNLRAFLSHVGLNSMYEV